MSLARDLKSELFVDDPDKDAFDVYHELAKRLSHGFEAKVEPAEGLDGMALLRDTDPLGREIVHMAFTQFHDVVREDARQKAAYSVAQRSHACDTQEGTEDRLAELNRLRLIVEEAVV